MWLHLLLLIIIIYFFDVSLQMELSLLFSSSSPLLVPSVSAACKVCCCVFLMLLLCSNPLSSPAGGELCCMCILLVLTYLRQPSSICLCGNKGFGKLTVHRKMIFTWKKSLSTLTKPSSRFLNVWMSFPEHGCVNGGAGWLAPMVVTRGELLFSEGQQSLSLVITSQFLLYTFVALS